MSARAYVSALPAVIGENIRRWTYQVYITNALQVITENTAVPASYFTEGKMGKMISRQWYEDTESDPQPTETRTPEEIIKRIRDICSGGES